MFQHQLDENELTKDLNSKIKSLSYSREDIEAMSKVIISQGVDEFIEESLMNLKHRML
jgi:hypothetical protein